MVECYPINQKEIFQDTYILNTSKKESHEYAGIILNLLIAIVSDGGREILFDERSMMKEHIQNEVLMFELLLGMKEWLKSGVYTYEEIEKLLMAINKFIDVINITC